MDEFDKMEATLDRIANLMRSDTATICGQAQRIAELEAKCDRLRVALKPFTRIKADDGDDFSTWPDGITIRCEITTTELRKAREECK